MLHALFPIRLNIKAFEDPVATKRYYYSLSHGSVKTSRATSQYDSHVDKTAINTSRQKYVVTNVSDEEHFESVEVFSIDCVNGPCEVNMGTVLGPTQKHTVYVIAVKSNITLFIRFCTLV